jgi:hypothetical protein
MIASDTNLLLLPLNPANAAAVGIGMVNVMRTVFLPGLRPAPLRPPPCCLGSILLILRLLGLELGSRLGLCVELRFPGKFFGFFFLIGGFLCRLSGLLFFGYFLIGSDDVSYSYVINIQRSDDSDSDNVVGVIRFGEGNDFKTIEITNKIFVEHDLHGFEILLTNQVVGQKQVIFRYAADGIESERIGLCQTSECQHRKSENGFVHTSYFDTYE